MGVEKLVRYLNWRLIIRYLCYAIILVSIIAIISGVIDWGEI